MELINPKGLNYPIYICTDSVVQFCEQLYKNIRTESEDGKTLIITDSEVYRHYQESINLMCKDEQIYSYVIPMGESSKSIEMASKIWSFMAERDFHRKDKIVAFGGGVVGDLAGFVASTYMRGIAWIQVPTTLLSQIDSSVGGKVAINLNEGKNLVGAFYNPNSVWICTAFLESLPDKTFCDGLGEMFKYGYLADQSILELLDYEEKDKPFKFNAHLRDQLQSNMTHLVMKCIQIKLAIVIKDFTETSERKYLNLGHTIGHAIESHENYAISHGHAVMLGIWWVIQLDASLHNEARDCYTELLEAHERRMTLYGFDPIHSLEVDRLLEYLKMDKKARADEVQFVMFNKPLLAANRKPLESLADNCEADSLEVTEHATILKAVKDGFRLESVSMQLICERLKDIQNEIKSK